MFSQIDEITYIIVRHRENGKQRIIRRGLTYEEARAYFEDRKTSGEGWYDAYREVVTKYEIVRIWHGGKRRVVKRNLTLEQAQAHCDDPKTAGEDWGDWYRTQIYQLR